MAVCKEPTSTLRIPFEQQLQTIAALYYSTNFIFQIGLFIWVSLMFTDFYFIASVYLLWLIYDWDACNRGGRRLHWFRNLKIWTYFRDYFPVKMVKTSELPTTKNYIMCYHPHGIICAGAFACFATESTDFKSNFPGITPHFITLQFLFRIPFRREDLLSAGACSASKEGIEWILTEKGDGNAVLLVVGGAAESLEAHPDTATLVLKRRKGFIKLALKHGASLVPVFAFGENEIYNQVKNPEGTLLRKVQNKLTKLLYFAPPLFYGRWFSWLPFRKPITVVVGKPIDLTKEPEPTEDHICAAQEKYIRGLTELFDENKEKYNPNLKLLIT